MTAHGLSKSRIIAWKQCPKRLWLQMYQRDLAEESTQTKQAFKTGNEVGKIAQQLCPNGILIENDDNLSAAINATREAISNYPHRPIFEATFQHEGLLVRADVLLPTANGYRMSEVKSKACVKPYHVDDCAVQAWVLKKNKIPLASVELVHIETSFVYRGDGNYHGLFKFVRLDEEIKPLMGKVSAWVKGARLTLSGEEPAIEPGMQCNNPFKCPFKAYCTRDMVLPKEPKYPLDILYGIHKEKKAELCSKGYTDARKVPPQYLNERQRWIQRVSKKGKPELLEGAAEKLAGLSYPRYYLDFETISPVVPRWAQSQPSTTKVPFQWSCHIEYAPGQLSHEMFLDVSGNDPRRALSKAMIKALKNEGPVIVYSQGFEKSRISELANLFPDLARKLQLIKDRVVDLLPITRQYYYHPDMKGSWSLKAVLPTVAPDLQYSSMEVGNGEEAQIAYLEIIHPDTPELRMKELTEGLREYCTLDTLAMVRLVWLFEGNTNFNDCGGK